MPQKDVCRPAETQAYLRSLQKRGFSKRPGRVRDNATEFDAKFDRRRDRADSSHGDFHGKKITGFKFHTSVELPVC